MRSVVCLVALCAFAGVADAGYQEEKDAKNLEVMERAAKNVKKDARFWDGKAIPAGVDLTAMEDYVRTTISEMNAMSRAWNDLSAKGQQHPRAKELIALKNDLVPWINAAAKALGEAQVVAQAQAKQKATDDEAARRQARETCNELSDRFQGDSSDLRELMESSWGYRGATPDDLRERKAALAKIAPACKEAKYAAILDTCQAHRGQRNEIATWADLCRAAADPNPTLRKGIIMEIESWERRVRSNEDPVKAFLEREGWIQVDSKAVAYDGQFLFGVEAKREILAQFTPMFDALGEPPPDDLPLFVELAAERDRLRAAADEHAPKWELKGITKCAGYWCKQVEKGVKAWHPKAKIQKVWEVEKGWHIVKNGVGAILYRQRDGYVAYQVPGEKWCQVRSWRNTEDYAGGGKYAKASGTRLNYVRFQSCP